jgi:hypothetical protein
MGATDVRAKYFLGSQLARDLRELPGKTYEDIYGSYGPRSYLYAEMVFGNTFIVNTLMTATPQEPIYAMRTPRAITLAEIVKRTGLSCKRSATFQSSAPRSRARRSRRYISRLTSANSARHRVLAPAGAASYRGCIE